MAGADFLKPKRLKKQLQAIAGAKRAKNAGEVAIVSATHAPTRRNDIQPLMATVMRPIDQLKPAPHRARVSTPELRTALVHSVSQYGILLPVLIDGQDQIIAGHELWQAAKEHGLEKIECRVAEHLSPVECEAASLALNKVGELADVYLVVAANGTQAWVNFGDRLPGVRLSGDVKDPLRGELVDGCIQRARVGDVRLG